MGASRHGTAHWRAKTSAWRDGAMVHGARRHYLRRLAAWSRSGQRYQGDRDELPPHRAELVAKATRHGMSKGVVGPMRAGSTSLRALIECLWDAPCSGWAR